MTRPYAKIDVLWAQSPKWYAVDAYLREAFQSAMPGATKAEMQTAMQLALQNAMHMHFVSILYCAQNVTDGTFLVAAVKGIGRCVYEESVDALFHSGLWENLPGGLAQVHDYLDYQTSAKARKEASERGRKKAESRWSQKNSDANCNANSNANCNGKNKNKNIYVVDTDVSTTLNVQDSPSEPKPSETPTPDPEPEPRPDVDAVIDAFQASLTARGVKRGRVTKPWREAARLMLDRDGRTVPEIQALCEWLVEDEFWRKNVLALPKLRQRYDQLRLAMETPRRRRPDDLMTRGQRAAMADFQRHIAEETAAARPALATSPEPLLTLPDARRPA